MDAGNCSGWKRRRGVSVLTLIVLMCLLGLGGLGAYFHFQRKAVEEMQALQAARVKDAQDALQRDVQSLLVESEKMVADRDIAALKVLIHKVSVLDTQGVFSADLARLKIKHRELVERLEKVSALEIEFANLLARHKVQEAERVIFSIEKLGGETANLKKNLATTQAFVRDRQSLLVHCEAAIESWQLDVAAADLDKLEKMGFEKEKALKLFQRIQDKQSAHGLIKAEIHRIRQCDTGQYSASLLQESAASLAKYPRHPGLLALHKKLESYPMELHVPGSVASLEDAVELARAGDVILLGEGVFYAEVFVGKAVEIRGAGREKTILESSTTQGPALTFQHKGESRLSGVLVKGDRDGETSHPLVLLDGADVHLENCHIQRSSGHGLAVIAGKLVAQKTLFSDNAWDGVAASGASAILDLRSCEARFNGEHGFDLFEGAQGRFTQGGASNNNKTGIVATGQHTSLSVDGFVSKENQEAGFYVSHQARLVGTALVAKANMYSGFVVSGAGSQLTLNGACSKENQEYGYLVDSTAKFESLNEGASEGNIMGLKSQKTNLE